MDFVLFCFKTVEADSNGLPNIVTALLLLCPEKSCNLFERQNESAKQLRGAPNTI